MQALHCEVTHTFTNKRFILTVVYVSNDSTERHTLWEFLISEANTTLPWLIVGDFNHLLHKDDRIGGVPVTLHDRGFPDMHTIYWNTRC